jgi:hypothetical protein
MSTIFFHPSLLLLLLDPGSEIRDPGWVKIRIRDKHPGSATLNNNKVGRKAYPADLEESLLLLRTDVLLVALTEGEKALVPQHRQLPFLTSRMRK